MTPAAQVLPANLPGGATLNYMLDGYYEYNFNHPPGRVNDLRAYDVLSNAFSKMVGLETLVLIRQDMVGHVLSMVDREGLLPAMSTISIVSLPPSAIAPLIQLAGRRKTNTKSSDISSVEIWVFEHGLSPSVVEELRRLEEIVPSVEVRSIGWSSSIRIEAIRKTLLPSGFFD